MNARGNRRLAKSATVTENDTATFPFWGISINVSGMTICQHDEHGRPVGKSEKVRNLQEGHDLCEARNYPGRRGKV